MIKQLTAYTPLIYGLVYSWVNKGYDDAVENRAYHRAFTNLKVSLPPKSKKIWRGEREGKNTLPVLSWTTDKKVAIAMTGEANDVRSQKVKGNSMIYVPRLADEATKWLRLGGSVTKAEYRKFRQSHSLPNIRVDAETWVTFLHEWQREKEVIVWH